MKNFRFSPIKNRKELFEALEYVHIKAHKICKENLGKLLPVAGNIGIFCHYEDEFEYLTNIRKELTDLNHNWNQKYFKLYNPIIFSSKEGIPITTYTFLYIRKPDEDTPNVGDVDFYLKPTEYKQLKQSVLAGEYKKGVKMFERPDLDMVRLYIPHIDVSAFVHSYNLKEVAT